MMNLPKKFLNEPIQPHSHSPDILTMRWHDGEHCPDNKRQGEVESSICEIELTRFAGRPPHPSYGEAMEKEGWLTVSTLEMTTSKSGRTSTRTITTVLTLEQAKRIANFILTGE